MTAYAAPWRITTPAELSRFRMIHRASADFWHDYRALPQDIRARADKQFALLKGDPNHGSLQFKKSAFAKVRKSGPFASR